MESETGMGWKGTLKVIKSNSPTLSRDICNWMRLFRVPIQPELEAGGNTSPRLLATILNPNSNLVWWNVSLS